MDLRRCHLHRHRWEALRPFSSASAAGSHGERQAGNGKHHGPAHRDSRLRRMSLLKLFPKSHDHLGQKSQER
jgi:hypothetical protein